MKKSSLKDLLESFDEEQLAELREALKIGGSDTDLRETVISMQAEIKEILGLVKPKPAPKEKPGLGDSIEAYFGVKK